MKRTVAVLPLLIFFQGCDALVQNQTKQPKQAKSFRPAVHRFVLSRAGVDVAFDTQTGQICRTWDWQPTGKAATVDPATGNVPQRKFGEFAPTCLSLYHQFPSGADAAAQIVLEEQGPN